MPAFTCRLVAFGAVSNLTQGSNGSIIPEPDMGTFPATA